MSQIKDVCWAYVAGFADGDGCIYVPANGKGAVRFELVQHPEQDWVLYEIQMFLETFGVSVKIYDGSADRFPKTTLKVFQHDDVLFVFNRLLPYLIVKRAKALEALRLLNGRKRSTVTHCRNGHLWEGNEYFNTKGVRQCKVCKNEAVSRSRATKGGD